MSNDGNIKIVSDVDVQGIAPGQFAVIYSKDKILCYGSAMIIPNVKKRRHHHYKGKNNLETSNND